MKLYLTTDAEIRYITRKGNYFIISYHTGSMIQKLHTVWDVANKKVSKLIMDVSIADAQDTSIVFKPYSDIDGVYTSNTGIIIKDSIDLKKVLNEIDSIINTIR